VRPFVLATLLATLSAGCERGVSLDKEAATRSPRETIEGLLAVRKDGSYGRMRSFILPERADEVIQTLSAIDEFLLANRNLCNYVRDEIGIGFAELIDQAPVAGNLEVFSPYVQLASETVSGDHAQVSFQIDGRLPVKRAELVLREGRWFYDPGEGFDPALPAAFKQMAHGLRQALEALRAGRPPREAILSDPEQLVREVRLRLQPGVQMLPMP